MQKFILDIAILQEDESIVVATTQGLTFDSFLADSERSQLDWHIKCVGALAELAVSRERISKIAGNRGPIQA